MEREKGNGGDLGYLSLFLSLSLSLSKTCSLSFSAKAEIQINPIGYDLQITRENGVVNFHVRS